MDAPPPASRLAFVDALRGLAALWVILYDLWTFQGAPELGPLTGLLRSGHLGVEVFMVLSGFCLFYPLVRRQSWGSDTWRRFAWRRARRILPPYYVAMIFAVGLPFALAPSFQTLGAPVPPPSWPSAWQWLSHLTLIHNLFPEVRSGLNPSFWSLSLEAQFYLIFPLMALALARGRLAGLLLLLGGCLAFRLGLGALDLANPAVLSGFGSILGRLTIFLAGMLAAWRLALLAPRAEPAPGGWWWLLMPGGLALGYHLYFHPVGLWPLSDLVLGATVATFLVRRGMGPLRGLGWLTHPYLVALGEISYSLYLIDRPICYHVSLAVAHLWPGSVVQHLALSAALGIPLSIAMAVRFHFWFERPFMDDRRPPHPALRPAPPAAAV